MSHLDERVLEARLEALERARAWSPRVISKLEALLRAADDAQLFRVNPITFATERHVEESEAIDLFLHAARAELFTMEWQLICPQCTDAVETLGALDAIGSAFHCDLCRTDLATCLDDLIQVTFTITPTLRRLRYHDPESLPIEEYCFGYHFSTGSRFSDGRPLAEGIRPFVALLAYVEAGQTGRCAAELHPGRVNGADRVSRAEIGLSVAGAPSTVPTTVRLRLEGGRFSCDATTVPPGPAVFEIENATSRRAAVCAVNMGPGHQPGRAQLPPFLSGKRLFVTHTFSELFRSQTVGKHGGLALREITLLFTDLKGSTELYERIGDLRAFHLVDQHFDRLGEVVRRHHGAVVKTIGDAVMATFARPAEALASAIEMLRSIEAFNRERGARDVILKIGLHSGPSIAVTLNERLDYFGQAVNIAARVQGLAEGDDICLTDPVRSAPGVAELLAGLQVTSREAHLRGIERPLQVHRARALSHLAP